MVHDDSTTIRDSDAELGAWLDTTLRAGFGSDQVDVAGLLTGSRNRARRLRTQRVTGVAAAALLLVALPAGFEVLRATPSTQTAPAAMMPSLSRPADTVRTVLPVAQPALTASPTPAMPTPSEIIPPVPVLHPTPGGAIPTGS